MKIKIYGYPKGGVHTDAAQRLQWAKENDMVFDLEQFNLNAEIDKNLFDWGITQEQQKHYYLVGEYAVDCYVNKKFSSIPDLVGNGENSLICWDGTNMYDLLNAFIGWDHHVIITEEQYNQFTPKPKLLASKFLEWYVDDAEDLQILGKHTLQKMLKTGYGDISVEELFNNCGAIQGYILEGFSEDNSDEYQHHEIQFINDLKK